MTWTETHRRWQALRTIEEQLAEATHPELPWNDELALIFGDRAGLLAALRYRHHLSVNTQMDTHLPERVLEEQRAELIRRTRGVLRVLQAEADADHVRGSQDHQDKRGTTRAVA